MKNILFSLAIFILPLAGYAQHDSDSDGDFFASTSTFSFYSYAVHTGGDSASDAVKITRPCQPAFSCSETSRTILVNQSTGSSASAMEVIDKNGKVISFINSPAESEMIPVPQGGEYTVKLIYADGKTRSEKVTVSQ
ncbi:MAG TPA: hypothetical protein VFU15_14230 [Bacteroidia bacterium]|nr:hypothetical protein [Bacteroidia bacterium]